VAHNIEPMDIAELITRQHPQNPKGHQIPSLIESIVRFGFAAPVLLCERTGKIAAGHGRTQAVMAMRQQGMERPEFIEGEGEDPWLVPVVRGWSSADDDELLAYVIADNRQTELGGWDDAILAEIGTRLATLPAGLTGTGLDPSMLAAITARLRGTPIALSDPDAIPERPKTPPVSQRGDVWTMGEHRVMCGDSTQAGDVDVLLAGAHHAPLLHADPPYGMGKENEGIANDNLRAGQLDAFQMAWWRAWRPYLADNATAYIWGQPADLWRLWYRGGLEASERFTFRNEVAWDKGGGGFGVGAETQRSYFPEERCLVFMFGEQGFGNVNKDDYWEGFEPIRSYLAAEMNKMHWVAADVLRLTGVGMFGHWFSKSQWTMMPERHYRTFQEAAGGAAFARPYNELRTLYDGGMRTGEHLSAKQEFYAQRSYFDNTHDKMTDVWRFNRVSGEERYGHATPKPVAMIARAIKTSTPADALVLEPFGGTGSTLIAAHGLGRVAYVMEIDPSYVDLIVRRYAEHTGVEAVRQKGAA
jgi:DNA modification methylase